MKRWIVVGGVVTFMALVCILLMALWVTWYVERRPTTEATPATTDPAPPLQVGQRYGFSISGFYLAGKVLELPHAGWVKVEVQDQGKSLTVLLRLQDIPAIIDNPPADWIGRERVQLSSLHERVQFGSLREVLDIDVVAVGDVP